MSLVNVFLSFVMLSVVMPNVIVLGVVAPLEKLKFELSHLLHLHFD